MPISPSNSHTNQLAINQCTLTFVGNKRKYSRK